MLDDGASVGHLQFWAIGSGRGASEVSIAVAVVLVPSLSVPLVFVTAVAPSRGGGGFRCARSGGRGTVTCFV